MIKQAPKTINQTAAQDHHFMRELFMHEAVIMKTKLQDAYPAYVRGDRRKRPKFWVPHCVFLRLLNAGTLVMRGSNSSQYCLKRSARQRIKFGQDPNRFANQHRHFQEREIYIPNGSRRPARYNQGLCVLERLGRKNDRSGAPILSAEQFEAGRQFAHDYARQTQQSVSTQNYKSLGVSGGCRREREENKRLDGIDAGARFSKALLALGPDLDRVVRLVCCEDIGLEELERRENWARSTGLTVLKLGLSRLVVFYGTRVGVAFNT